jgi:hypothetical protein
MGRYTVKTITALTTISVLMGCSKAAEETSVVADRYLYISTGLCNSGQGFTAPAVTTVGKTLSRLNLSTDNYQMVKDYADLSEEVVDTFVNGMVDGGDGYIYAAVENATATGNRRIDKIKKENYGARTTWYENSSVLTTVMRGIARAADGGILLGRTSIVDRFDSTPTRKMATAALAWGETFAGACLTNNTAITDLIALPVLSGATYGKFIYSHQAVGQQDIGIIGMNGNTAAVDCLANQAGASALTNSATANLGWGATLTANASPTSMVYIPTPTGATTGKLLVSYATNAVNTIVAAGLNNGLVMYDVNETSTTAATISNGQVLYHDVQYFFGVSSMAYDSTTGILYAALSNSLSITPTGYNIEKFQIDLNTPGATRLTNSDNSSYQAANSFNNCVTSMFVGN